MTDSNRTEKGPPKKMSILWVSFTLLDSDLHKTALLHILRQFVELGHKPCLLAIQSKNKYEDTGSQARIMAVPLRYIPFVSTVMFTVVENFFLPFYILLSKPDFIIYDPDIHILSCFCSLIVSKFKKVKVILDIRTVPVETVGLRGFLKKFWFSVSVLVAKHLFDGATIITPLMKKQISSDFNLNSNKIGVWTSGVSEILFNPKNTILEGLELKRKLGYSKNFVVFYHGVFTPNRALKETIDAVKILIAKYPDIIFFLLGSGPSSTILKRHIEKEDLKENVIIHNPVNQVDVPKFISFCDVSIVPLPDHPYWRFQSPLKLLEYLAMEKVTILTDIPAHRDVIRDAKCGIYVSSVDPVEIARAIEYAYLNKCYLKEWGQVGRKIVLERYTWGKVAKDLENYLFSIR